MIHRIPLLSALPLAFAAALPGVPATAAAPEQIIDSATALRCSATFAILDADRRAGLPDAARYPAPDGRAREFFVITAGRMMDEEKLTRDQVRDRIAGEVLRLRHGIDAAPVRGEALAGLAQPCLGLLDLAIPLAKLPVPHR